jgi:hypothetical protein
MTASSAGAFPASLEFPFTHSWENVRFSVEHDFGEREKFIWREQQVKILEGFGLDSNISLTVSL